MTRLFRLSLGVTFVIIFHAVVLAAAAWTGGRGPQNAGSFPGVGFPTAPTVVWTAHLAEASAGVAPSNALYSGNHVVIAFDKTLFAVDAATGELVWTQTLPAKPVGDLLLLDKQVILALPEGGVYAYSVTTGELAWAQIMQSRIANSPCYTDNVVVVSTSSNTIEVIARKTGKSIVSIDVGNIIDASPLLIGKAIVLGFTQGQLVRIENGVNTWAAALPKTGIRRNLVTNGDMIFVTTDRAVFALNMLSPTNQLQWSVTRGDILPDPVTSDGRTVYLATSTGQLHALLAQTGRSKWGADGVTLPAPAIASPLVIGERLLVRMKYGKLASIDKNTGDVLWNYTLPSAGDITLGMPVVSEQGVFFGTSQGTLYRLDSSMADADPPTFREALPTRAGTDFSSTQPLQYLGAIVEDAGSGLLPGSVTLHLDEKELTDQLQYDVNTGYHYVKLAEPTVPAQGMHRITMTAKDYQGNEGRFEATFYVGNAATIERVPIAINGEFLPRVLRVRPGTIVEWINRAGSPRTVVADDGTFSSDAVFSDGISDGGRWAWVVPEEIPAGTVIPYHCRLYGEPGQGKEMGPGLTGLIEIVSVDSDLPGLPQVAPGSQSTFPIPAFAP